MTNSEGFREKLQSAIPSMEEAAGSVRKHYQEGVAEDVRSTADTYESIARRWGVSQQYIYGLAKHLGIRCEADAVQKLDDDDVMSVEFGDEALYGGIFVGSSADPEEPRGFYIHAEDEDVIYTRCPLCGDDGTIYGGNRWYTQACCYFGSLKEDISLEVERWTAKQLLAGESIDHVHAQLSALRTHPAVLSYVERISSILNDDRAAVAYTKYLSTGARRYDWEIDHERAAIAVMADEEPLAAAKASQELQERTDLMQESSTVADLE